MPTTNERVSILETKVDGLKEDITTMRKENREDHARVIDRLERLQDLKNYALGFLALLGIILTWIAVNIDWRELITHALK